MNGYPLPLGSCGILCPLCGPWLPWAFRAVPWLVSWLWVKLESRDKVANSNEGPEGFHLALEFHVKETSAPGPWAWVQKSPK